jgi:hypothetical protein
MSVTRNLNLGPSQVRLKRRRLFYIRLTIIFILLAVIIFTLAIFSSHEKVKIQTIIVSGNAAVATDDILKIANRDMAGRYWYLFSRSNSLIFPRLKIKQDILTKLKTIKSVDINFDNWQQISIKVEERKAHSAWCGSDPAVKADCYFVDNTGLIYNLAPTFSGNMFIRDYGTTTSTIGGYFLTPTLYTQIFSLIDVLDKKGIKVTTVAYDERDFKFGLENGPTLIFNLKNSLDQSFGNLFTAIQTGDLDLAKNAGTINYIDLRFDNKIVVGKKQI